MLFGRDFFKILKLVFYILRAFAEIFGDDDDRQNANSDLGPNNGPKSGDGL